MTGFFRGGKAYLILAAFIWGSAFVAQSVGMDYVGPFCFNGFRSVLGAIVLIPCAALLDRMRGTGKQSGSLWQSRDLWTGGLFCGMILAVATALQQIGLAQTTVGKAGFLTALYIVIVPLLGVFVGHRVQRMVWPAVALATVGLYLLSITGDFALAKGDGLVIGCAFVFSIHILATAHYAPKVDCVRLSAIQFLTAGVLNLIAMAFVEQFDGAALLRAWIPLCYAGILSSAVAYTFQLLGQRKVEPAIASLILSCEAVVAAVFGALLLQERFTGREFLGCVLIFLGLLLVQLPQVSAWMKKKRQEV